MFMLFVCVSVVITGSPLLYCSDSANRTKATTDLTIQNTIITDDLLYTCAQLTGAILSTPCIQSHNVFGIHGAPNGQVPLNSKV